MSDPPPSTVPSYDPGYAAHATTDLAGFWRRFAAYFIDVLLVTAAATLVHAMVNAIMQVSTDIGTVSRGWLTALIVQMAYLGYFWSRGGQSVGYMALGLRLVRADGSPVTPGIAVLRAFLVFASFWLAWIPAIVSAFMVGMGDRKQAIHDRLVGTLVVRA
jgi:uncharacterized RDD family membrane protein YckC